VAQNLAEHVDVPSASRVSVHDAKPDLSNISVDLLPLSFDAPPLVQEAHELKAIEDEGFAIPCVNLAVGFLAYGRGDAEVLTWGGARELSRR
jgi:hypothetical protein